MTTLTATTARRDFFELIKGTTEAHRTYRIQHRSGAAILLSEDDYEGLLETMELLSLPEFRRRLRASVRQMKAGQTTAMAELFETEQ